MKREKTMAELLKGARNLDELFNVGDCVAMPLQESAEALQDVCLLPSASEYDRESRDRLLAQVTQNLQREAQELENYLSALRHEIEDRAGKMKAPKATTSSRKGGVLN